MYREVTIDWYVSRVAAFREMTQPTLHSPTHRPAMRNEPQWGSPLPPMSAPNTSPQRPAGRIPQKYPPIDPHSMIR